jgi:glycerol kinase
MFGHGRYAAGTIKATYGTGSSLMALTSGLIGDTPALARTIAWAIDGVPQYAVEGNITMTGSAMQWLGEFLGLADPTRELAALAETVEDAAGVFFVPAMAGLGAPYWKDDARGAITGLSRSHARAHVARAALESIAFQVADVFLAMEEASAMRFSELRTDGGATRNASLMQFQSDLLACPVLRSRDEELSALGAAWLSGLALGWWRSLDEVEKLSPLSDRYEPTLDAERRKQLYAGWKNAVSSVLPRKAVYA